MSRRASLYLVNYSAHLTPLWPHNYSLCIWPISFSMARLMDIPNNSISNCSLFFLCLSRLNPATLFQIRLIIIVCVNNVFVQLNFHIIVMTGYRNYSFHPSALKKIVTQAFWKSPPPQKKKKTSKNQLSLKKNNDISTEFMFITSVNLSIYTQVMLM